MSDHTADAQRVYEEFDSASRALQCFQMTDANAVAMLPAAERLEFDRRARAASDRWQKAYDAKQALIRQPRS